MGTAGLRPLADLGLEIFYSLAPGSWGNGYTTEAARAVLDHALGLLGLQDVRLAGPRNQRGAVALARCEREGVAGGSG